MLVLGLALMVAAWPDFRAHLTARAGDSAAALLREGQLPTEDGFRRLLSSRETAARWSPKASFDRDRGLAYVALSQDAEEEAEQVRLLGEAEAAFKAAVGRVPTNPEGLSLLAYVESELGRTDEAVKILRLGCELAPYAPEQAMIRTWVTMAVWDELAPADHPCAYRNFRVAMTRDPDRFIELVAGQGFVRQVRPAVADDELLSARFEEGVQALIDQQ